LLDDLSLLHDHYFQTQLKSTFQNQVLSYHCNRY